MDESFVLAHSGFPSVTVDLLDFSRTFFEIDERLGACFGSVEPDGEYFRGVSVVDGLTEGNSESEGLAGVIH